jgi:hypothetical protein
MKIVCNAPQAIIAATSHALWRTRFQRHAAAF